MHIQKPIKKGVAMMLAFMLSFSVFFNSNIVVRAEESVTFDSTFENISPNPVIDVILNQQGVFLSGSVIGRFYTEIMSEINQSISTVLDYARSVNSDGNVDVFDVLSFTDTLTSEIARLYMVNCIEPFKESITMTIGELTNAIEINPSKLTRTMFKNGEDNHSKGGSHSHGGGGLRRDYSYTLDEDCVSAVYEKFKVWYSEDYDYIVFYTRPYSDIFRFYSELCGASVNNVASQAVSFMELMEEQSDCYFYVEGRNYTADGCYASFILRPLPKEESYFGRIKDDEADGWDYIALEYATYTNNSPSADNVETMDAYGQYIINDSGFVGKNGSEMVYSSLTSWKTDLLDMGMSSFNAYYLRSGGATLPELSVYDVERLFYEVSQGNRDLNVDKTNNVFTKKPERFEVSKIDESNFTDGEISTLPTVQNPINSPLYTTDVFDIDSAPNTVVVYGDYIIDKSSYSYTEINNYIGDNIENGDYSAGDVTNINNTMNVVGNDIIINQGNGDIVVDYDSDKQPETTASPIPTEEPTTTEKPTTTETPLTTKEPIVFDSIPTIPPMNGDNDDGTGGLSSLISFVLGVLGFIPKLIMTLVSTFTGIINSFVGGFNGITGFLGVIFSFLPQDLVNVLTLGVTGGIITGLWKGRGK